MHEHTANCKYSEEMYSLLCYIQRHYMDKQAIEWFVDLMARMGRVQEIK